VLSFTFVCTVQLLYVVRYPVFHL